MRWIAMLALAAGVVRRLVRTPSEEPQVVSPRLLAERKVREGHALFRGGDYRAAGEAYAQAEQAAVGGLAGQLVGFVRLHMAHALFAAGEFVSASRALEACLAVLPELPYLQFRRQQLYDDPLVYGRGYACLVAEASVTGDAERLFLAGYESYFNGRRRQAADYFEAALARDPSHPGAVAFTVALLA